MILFMTLITIAIILAGIALATVGIIGAITILIFGDAIACVVLIVLIIRSIIRRK